MYIRTTEAYLYYKLTYETKGSGEQKTVNLEYFNNWILFFGNKVTTEIIQIAAEHELLCIEYKIQTETEEYNHFTHIIA